MKITMDDIAEKLGIHRSTVSLALRNSPKISATTQKRVKETAIQMGYKANPYVSALMRSRRSGKDPDNPPVIALITADRTKEHWKTGYNPRRFVDGANKVAQNLGIRLEPFWAGDTSHERLHQILLSRGIQGAVLLHHGELRNKLHHDWTNLSIVNYGICDHSFNTDWVSADLYGNMELILDTLNNRGIERIGFVMAPPYTFNNQNRWLSCYESDQRQKSEAKRLEPLIHESPNFDRFKRWFKKNQPKVVLCVRPPMVIRWLERMNLRVPEDVGLVTVGNAETDGEISGIIEQPELCGKIAIEMLMSHIHNNEFGVLEEPRLITVRGQWNEGRTL
ncbi:LacI family DNA-binding transcriptional regulator [Pelagicoccus mobilis]|uniref:LacI family DNA-binding transcriptional regulator n=1 Tax=Pelagicoccus mobilis TaxID=415221 RepID=A0A934VST5_9BACT|nr:LacI family DNA-binding transcriptional regulator [Pelagicoccus mobilis]MBK1879350.1 LacI family DNA-binding transcriptional regulator [Pelagicoccus mobilis]